MTDESIKVEVDEAADSAPNGDSAALISSLVERLRFFFSNANLRQDRWMRDQLSSSDNGLCDGPLSLDVLLRFNTLKSITTDKSILAAAAKSDELKGLISYDEEKEEVKRVSPFDFKTMGDGSKLSLYVKNVPVTEPPPEDEEGAEPAKEKFRPRYSVTRDEVKALFEGYGRVALVQLRYGKKQQQQTENDEKYNAPNARGFKGGESYPLGVAIIEFESTDGIEKACEDLLPKKDDENGEKEDPTTILEMKGNKLVVEKMRPSKFFKNLEKGGDKKRSRDDDPTADNNDGEEKADEDAEDAKFEPITLDWEKGCVIALAGLDAASCDRESIRDAVSEILGVTTDVKTSGLYVDYNRGATTGNLRLKSPKPDEMKELVSKLTDGSLLVANAKVESAKILEGEEEEKYYQNFIAWLNTRKKMKDEEKRSSTNNNNHRNNHNNKRQKFGGRGGGRGRGGRGRGRR